MMQQMVLFFLKKIYKEFHSIYQHGNNTRAQFEKYLRTYYNMTLLNEQQGNHEPSLTTESVLKEFELKNKEKQEALINLISSRNHELVDGVNGSSVIVVKCKTHNTVHTTTVNNYKKAKTWIRCCAKEHQSQATAYYNTLR